MNEQSMNVNDARLSYLPARTRSPKSLQSVALQNSKTLLLLNNLGTLIPD